MDIPAKFSKKMAYSSLLILSLIIPSGEHPIMNLEKIFVHEGLEFSEVLGKKMIDTETELEKIGHNNKFVSNSMSSLEVRKIRPNEYMFIQVRSLQFPANLENDMFLVPRNKTNNIIPIKLAKQETRKENSEKFFLHCVGRERDISVQPREILALFSTTKPTMSNIR